ncbi:integrase family protein [Terriglobus saanensis SP1PR4]|uniref:Integrase family protein n=2 Tax=Terriglobus saanensis TaxID=870903 RepID=E8V6R3_TERSS|nr:integrase family protein [Terriglobus saanensis SP1PR4]
MEWRQPYLKNGTAGTYLTYIAGLDRFFRALRLEEITPGHMREYQIHRSRNEGGFWAKAAGPSVVNHELNTLSQILDHAGLWEPMKKFYTPLKLPRWTPPRTMTQAEEDQLFAIAASNPDWELAYLVASITNNTTASGVELRYLKISDVMLHTNPPQIHIASDAVKNEFRGRRIPLNETALKQFERALMRAHRLGSTQQTHYLFPLRVHRGAYDPTRPASSSWLRKPFDELRKAAGLPWLRPHDLRHQAITRMLECGAPETSVMAIAGHVSRQMMEHYSHTRMDAKMEVLRAIEPQRFSPALRRRA